MLEALQIRDFALIDDVEVSFGPGFNVLTGETGAGKSIVVNALSLVLGARASAESVRAGKTQARIDAVFQVAPSVALREMLAAQAIEPEDDTLHLTRIVTSSGRSRAYVCGTLVPVSVLADVGDELVDLHGQHEHQSLLKPDRQLELLDSFGGIEPDVARVAERVREWRRIDTELHALESDDRDRLRQLEFHRFELEEIEKAALESGEEQELKHLRSRMTNAEEIMGLRSNLIRELLESEESPPASQLLAHALSDLERLAELDSEYAPLLEQFNRVYAEFESFAGPLERSTDNFEYDPDQLNSINARLAMLSDLKRKYGATIDEVLAYRERIAAEIDRYERRDEHLENLRLQSEEARSEAESCAAIVSKKRIAAAKKLNRGITGVLSSLGMSSGVFEVFLQPCELNARGQERAEFQISANLGERPKPLRQVASGGEISRVMLAIKSIFADADPVGTLVFDEIDAGIGGAVANQVASTMGALAYGHQVICVTHLAQIAARAEVHFRVSKASVKRKTQTEVLRVEDEERIQELARLLDGSLSDASIHHARTLLGGLERESA